MRQARGPAVAGHEGMAAVGRVLARFLSTGSSEPAAVPPGPSARLDFDPTTGPVMPRSGENLSPLLLLVDDDQHGREGWAEFFSQSGYRIAQASDGDEALRKINDRAPDIILVDLGIPRLNGWELTRRVKTDPRWTRISVIVLSGLDYPDALERATAAGCDAFASKPCEPLRLLAIVRGLLARRVPASGNPAA
jgi:CheY-like chemotaxis protein